MAGPYMRLALSRFNESDFEYWLIQFGWGIIFTISFTLLNISMAFIKKTSQHVFLTSLLSVIIAQILISQDIQKLSLILGILFIILTEISIRRYSGKIE